MLPFDVLQITLLLVCILTFFGLSYLCSKHFISHLIPGIEETQILVETLNATQKQKSFQLKNEKCDKIKTKHLCENQFSANKPGENSTTFLTVDLAP